MTSEKRLSKKPRFEPQVIDMTEPGKGMVIVGGVQPPASEFEKFDAVVGKLLSVSHKELQAREKKYQRRRKRKKRVKT